MCVEWNAIYDPTVINNGLPDKIHNLSQLCLVENVDQIVGLNSRVSGKEEDAFNYQPN